MTDFSEHPPGRTFRAVDIIRKKRDGHELSAAEIHGFVAGYTAGEIPDYQASSWLMAALLRGLTRAETAALTDAMLHEIISTRSGYVTAIAGEMVGTACVVLGGGREKKEDSVDPAVGIVLNKKVAGRVTAGESLCTIHYNSESRAAAAKQLLEQSYQIADAPPDPERLVRRVITSADARQG